MWFKPLGIKGHHAICMKEENCLRHLDRSMWRSLNYIKACRLLLALPGHLQFKACQVPISSMQLGKRWNKALSLSLLLPLSLPSHLFFVSSWRFKFPCDTKLVSIDSPIATTKLLIKILQSCNYMLSIHNRFYPKGLYSILTSDALRETEKWPSILTKWTHLFFMWSQMKFKHVVWPNVCLRSLWWKEALCLGTHEDKSILTTVTLTFSNYYNR